jgi:hypothetical protein
MRRCALVMAAGAAALALPAAAELVLYSGEAFSGRSFSVMRNMSDLEIAGLNERASSAIVYRNRYEVCEHARFQGRCMVLRPGRYPSLESMGLGERISSVHLLTRTTEPTNYAPPPPPMYDSRPRKDETLFQAEVVAVRAVYGAPQQRCWIEREQASEPAVGAVVGAVLGHQVGSGRGKDVSNAAGAALGYNIARDAAGETVATRDVRKCARAPGPGKPEYWDVTYVFKGREHYMQTSSPPGRTVTVNQRGDPRG